MGSCCCDLRNKTPGHVTLVHGLRISFSCDGVQLASDRLVAYTQFRRKGTSVPEHYVYFFLARLLVLDLAVDANRLSQCLVLARSILTDCKVCYSL